MVCMCKKNDQRHLFVEGHKFPVTLMLPPVELCIIYHLKWIESQRNLGYTEAWDSLKLAA